MHKMYDIQAVTIIKRLAGDCIVGMKKNTYLKYFLAGAFFWMMLS